MARLKVGLALDLDGRKWQVAENPTTAGVALAIEGPTSVLYRLDARDGLEPLALKLFSQPLPNPAAQCQALARYSRLPGLEVAERSAVSDTNPAVKAHGELRGSIVMPWVDGPAWSDLIRERRPLKPSQCLLLARGLLQVLYGLQQAGVSHGDLSASNLLLSIYGRMPGTRVVSLVDLEQLFGPGLPAPPSKPRGSPGYAHHETRGGLWNADGDRFAGALVTAEILGWCRGQVRAAATPTAYFAADEMQQECPRFQLLHQAIGQDWGAGVARLLNRAWNSPTLSSCPTFDEWLGALPHEAPVLVEAETGPSPATILPTLVPAAAAPSVPALQARPPGMPMALKAVLILAACGALGAGGWFATRARSGSVDLSSDPSGAQVSVDGTPRGVTPTHLQGLAAGSHMLHLTQTGYEDLRQEVAVQNGEANVLTLSLHGRAGALLTLNPPDSMVQVNGQEQRPEPGSNFWPLPGGHQVVTFQKTGYATRSESIDIPADRPVSVSITLSPDTHGHLSVTGEVPTDAQIQVLKDGQTVCSRSSLPFDQALDPGSYELKATARLCTPFRQSFNLALGQPLHLTVDLHPDRGVLRISTHPAHCRLDVQGAGLHVAPCRLELKPGPIRIHCSHAGYKPADAVAQIRAGETDMMEVSLARKATHKPKPAPTPAAPCPPVHHYCPPVHHYCPPPPPPPCHHRIVR